MPGVIVHWITVDGEEHEEAWPDPERFRAWATSERLRASFTIYQVPEDLGDDDQDDWLVIDQGRVG